ncbi:hypothetical protein AMTR_s00063p00082610 [Amborella trichopoda]|uniref:Uncharacterized protein n=1 Tax=Amborella trichopoda TaxID=13333 RepID=U5D789_AMBTC|nr:hypothetical protein AMTR_s00063p00082610 [Amborella trichopoda]
MNVTTCNTPTMHHIHGWLALHGIRRMITSRAQNWCLRQRSTWSCSIQSECNAVTGKEFGIEPIGTEEVREDSIDKRGGGIGNEDDDKECNKPGIDRGIATPTPGMVPSLHVNPGGKAPGEAGASGNGKLLDRRPTSVAASLGPVEEEMNQTFFIFF